MQLRNRFSLVEGLAVKFAQLVWKGADHGESAHRHAVESRNDMREDDGSVVFCGDCDSELDSLLRGREPSVAIRIMRSWP